MAEDMKHSQSISLLSLALLGVGASAAFGDENGLSIRIQIPDSAEPNIEIEESFHVVIQNSSDQPIRIWNPRSKNGHDQITLHWVNLATGEKHVTRKRVIEGEGHWENRENSIDQAAETIEIAPHDQHTVAVSLDVFLWGKRQWTGRPDPNSGDDFSITARFESTVASLKTKQPVWFGTVISNDVTVKVVAREMKTPHDYLWNEFPRAAHDMMKANPAWIDRRDDESRTPLHIAARFGYANIVKWLLDNGAVVDAQAYNKFTPLHLAKQREIVELILQKKPDLTRRDAFGKTALQDAVEHLLDARGMKDTGEWHHIIELYLQAGAEYDIHSAIKLDDLKRVKNILRESPKFAHAYQKKSPLRLAASLGRLDFCKHLIKEHRVDVDDFERGMGYPIIKEALAHPKIVRLLIENGADLQTPITWRGTSTGRRLILSNATALHFAARDGVPETIGLLLDVGVEMFATTSESFWTYRTQTALDMAVNFGQADNAIALLTHAKFDEKDVESRQKLLDRCLVRSGRADFSSPEARHLELVETLIGKGADPNATLDGVSAIHAAATKIRPNSKAQNKRTGSLIALLQRHGATLDFFSAVAIGDETQVARMLKQNAKLANSRSYYGYPALHFAVGMNYKSIVKMLLDSGGDIVIQNKAELFGHDDETALHNAAFWHRYEIAKLLLDAGADVNALTKSNRTPLHVAARSANLDVVRLLLQRGAKMDAKDKEGDTPLDECGHAPAVEEVFRKFRLARE